MATEEKRIPTIAELLATMRKESALVLAIRDAAQAEANAIQALCNGLGNSKKASIEQVGKDCDTLNACRLQLIDAYRAFCDWELSKVK